MLGPAELAADRVEPFISAGQAVVTIRSKRTGKHYTYRILRVGRLRGRVGHYIVMVMISPTSYVYLGTIRGEDFDTTDKSTFTRDAPSFQGFAWLWKHRRDIVALKKSVEVYHEGQCGRCGRVLTHPESLKTGLGPICAQRRPNN